MKLTHPESKQTIEVAPGDSDRYLSQGWVRPAPKKKTTADRASVDESGTAPRTTTQKESTDGS